MDEKSQIQALDRTAPILPMLPGTPARARHDHVRVDTSSLSAAVDIDTGTVISSLHARHRAIEFKKFLATIDREVLQRGTHRCARPQCRRPRLDPGLERQPWSLRLDQDREQILGSIGR